ncbi:uncharacterized protein LOC143861347 [Tasmannia lanceolata]|uniref:uncharacterized protein LOC143861347 n=1 Tax=Tasmannia lanceolata TaxID=3420 RepID=UPI004062DE99
MEMLSVRLEMAIQCYAISSPFSSGNITTTHLLYADDLMIFASGNSANATGIKNCLLAFANITGLEANIEKSEIFFAGTSTRIYHSILNYLNFKEGKLPLKYLGLPLIFSRLSINDCTPLISKVRKRIQAWHSKSLSQSGKIELVKSVLCSFQIYWASAFNIPKTVLSILLGISYNPYFIWGGSEGAKRHHSVGWDSFCRPKLEGGVGLRSLEDINKALQLKILWNLLQENKSLWSSWFNQKYRKKNNVWTLAMPSKPSWSLRSLFRAREDLKLHVCYRVGDERNIDLWYQPWHPMGILSNILPRRRMDSSLDSLRSLDEAHWQGEWNPSLRKESLREEMEVLNKAIWNNEAVSYAIWKSETDGVYCISSV